MPGKIVTMNQIKSVMVRITLFVHSLMIMYVAYERTREIKLWLLLLVHLVLFAEGIVVVYKRDGHEWKWFCPCFMIYLGGTLPGIWAVELKNHNIYFSNSSVIKKHDSYIEFMADAIPLKVIEELLPYVLLLGRWFLPRGDLPRKELSQLLFVYIAIASDIMEIFALFDIERVMGDKMLVISVLSVWSLSLLQFSMVLTSTQSSRRARNVGVTESNAKMEAASLILSALVQEVPFFAVRVYTMVYHRLITFSLVFFSAKNLLVLLLVFYRVTVLSCGWDPQEKSTVPENTDNVFTVQGGVQSNTVKD